MSLPRLVKEAEATDGLWRRTIRDAINALIRRTSGTGPTSERPANPDVGLQFYDVTLGKPIWWHPSGVWKDATGATV
jgi:hypothetical protein